jgi:hypothetical protein
VLAADVDRLIRVARPDVELARGLGDLLEHPLRVEVDAVAVLDPLPGAPEDLDRVVEQLTNIEARGILHGMEHKFQGPWNRSFE